MTKPDLDVIIIGAGISGLSCANHLIGKGLEYVVLEAGPRIGGRVQSDRVEGFVLDHGFQVLQTAYPEARRQLNFSALDLKPFAPGVVVRCQGQFFYICDPIRRPQNFLSTLTAPIGRLSDRLRMVKLFAENRLLGTDGIFQAPDLPTIDFLKERGFSDQMIQRFFKPFFAGACLDPEINASSRVFRYLFDVFASGDAALPARGMGEIPAQLVSGLARGRIRLNARVASVDPGRVTLTSGETIQARAIVIATPGPEAARFLNVKTQSDSWPERCLYFSAPAPPIPEPFLILNGEGRGCINNVAVPTLAAPSYSLSGRHLVAVVVLGQETGDHGSLEPRVRQELLEWFGSPVHQWKHLKTYRIDHALPDQSPPVSHPGKGGTRIRQGIYALGEYQRVPGIQWALLSGRLAAGQICEDLA